MKEENAMGGSINGNEVHSMNSFLEKDLEAALDSFDNLFCRRCLVSGIPVHHLDYILMFHLSLTKSIALFFEWAGF